MNELVSIEKHGNGWTWEVRDSETDVVSRWRTNTDGEGLFFWSDVNPGWHQTHGSLQFSARSEKALIERLGLRDTRTAH